MEKKEKLKILSCLVQELDLTAKEVSEYLLAENSLADVTEAKEYKTPDEILPGMFVYADGLIYPEIIEGHQIQAVVGYIEGKTVYAVCLQEKKLPWSGDWLEAKATREMTGGQEATCKILEAARQTGKKAEAAQWCHGYVYDGVKSGEAFLPSIDELEKLFANKAAIDASLKALGAALLDGWYWSSTEHDDLTAWEFYMVYGSRNDDTKGTNNDHARPVLALKL